MSDQTNPILFGVSEPYVKVERKESRLILYVAGIFFLLSVVIATVGIVLITRRPEKCGKLTTMDQYCSYSNEAKKMNLDGFLNKVKKTYFLHSPNQIAYQPDLKTEELNKHIKRSYVPYDPRPAMLKAKTDAALALLKEMGDIKYNEALLKPREKRVIAQVKHFLKQNFGNPYDEHFYAGDWMLGPNYFCWQPICALPYDVNAIGYIIKPKNLSDFEIVLQKIKSHKDTISHYINNMRMGINAGYVRTKRDCIAGRNAFIEKNVLIGSTRKSDSVLSEWYTAQFLDSNYLQGINESVKREWMKNHGGATMKSSLENALIEGVGQPVLDLINYLEFNHSRHCLPESISSGLGNLPVDYIYTDGIPDKRRKTTKVLPITGTKLSGKKTYELILPYFTTSNITPDEIHKKGKEQLAIFYPKAVDLVKKVTKEPNETQAIKAFRKLLNSPSQWYGPMKFPDNESNDAAHKTCIDHESAAKYCPVRWKYIQKWADWIRQVMSKIYPKITKSFHFTGEKNTVPGCPILMWPHHNPSSGAMYFAKSDSKCSSPTQFGLPFFLERYGPKYHEWSLTAHESRPGHHTQFQGTEEHFRDTCGGIISWINEKGYFVNFIEGWALYSENPILSDDTDLYKDNMLQKLGMLKWQIFRAVRLIVDTGLHYRGENSTWALAQFDKYTWDTTDFVVKEITRYMSDPGQATAYMLGRLDILELRQKAEKELGQLFNIKDFHYQILSQGCSPMMYIKDNINSWINCVKDQSGPLCDYVLTPKKTLKKRKLSTVSNDISWHLKSARVNYV